ncbi:MAG: hypothetical protein WBP29_15210 [Candidatus Zixiibacteriota bacterium]
MSTNERESFNLDVEAVRSLARVLDMKLGIRVRKIVMAGHERLTLHTSASAWSNFMANVSHRLNRIVGDGGKRNLLIQAGVILPSKLEAD